MPSLKEGNSLHQFNIKLFAQDWCEANLHTQKKSDTGFGWSWIALKCMSLYILIENRLCQTNFTPFCGDYSRNGCF